MVIFFSHNDEVSVACADGVEEHVHVHTLDDAGSSGGVNFKWTLEQTAMIRQCVQNEQTRPAIIRRNLENANLFLEGKSPTNQQLNNKIAKTSSATSEVSGWSLLCLAGGKVHIPGGFLTTKG